jgi:hypothetical protein
LVNGTYRVIQNSVIIIDDGENIWSRKWKFFSPEFATFSEWCFHICIAFIVVNSGFYKP